MERGLEWFLAFWISAFFLCHSGSTAAWGPPNCACDFRGTAAPRTVWPWRTSKVGRLQPFWFQPTLTKVLVRVQPKC